MSIRRMELVLDDLDYETIQGEITKRQVLDRIIDPAGESIVPDGESNLAGAILAEVVRDLQDLRNLQDLYDAEATQ